MNWRRILSPVPESTGEQRNADLDHIDPETVAAWKERGPGRVRAALAGHLRRIAAEGLLDLPDPSLAAVHLVQLTAGSVAADPVIQAGVGFPAGLPGWGCRLRFAGR